MPEDDLKRGLVATFNHAATAIKRRMSLQARLFPQHIIKAFEEGLAQFLTHEASDKQTYFNDAQHLALLKKYISDLALQVTPQIEALMLDYKQKLKQALFDANLAVRKHAKETVREKSIDLIVGVINSARQSFVIDLTNGQHGSCMVVTEGFIELLEDEVGVPCVMNRSLLSDGYGNLPPGSNFNYIANGDFELCTPWFFDNYKGSIYYTMTHQVCDYFKGATVWFDGVDDKLEYLQHQMFFFKGGHNLPKGLTLRLYQYNGETFQLAKEEVFNKKTYPAIIQGKGICDSYYNANVRKMIEASSHHWGSPDSAGERSAISYYGENELKYKSERLLSLDNLVEEIKLVYEQWKLRAHKHYTNEEIIAFHAAFDDLYTSLQFDILEQKKLGYSEEAMQMSPAGVTARECLRLLYVALQKRFYSKTQNYGHHDQGRQQQLLLFAKRCGQRTPFIYSLTLAFIEKTSLMRWYQLCVQVPGMAQVDGMLRYVLTSWPISTPGQWVGRLSNQLLFQTTHLAPKVAAVDQRVQSLVKADEKAWQENRAKLTRP